MTCRTAIRPAGAQGMMGMSKIDGDLNDLLLAFGQEFIDWKRANPDIEFPPLAAWIRVMGRVMLLASAELKDAATRAIIASEGGGKVIPLTRPDAS